MTDSVQSNLPGISAARAMKRVSKHNIMHALFIAERSMRVPLYKILETITSCRCGEHPSPTLLDITCLVQEMSVGSNPLSPTYLDSAQAEALNEMLLLYARRAGDRQQKQPLEDYEFAMRTATWLNGLR